jgi:diguanylate cyclase (GGDEF)-like protein
MSHVLIVEDSKAVAQLVGSSIEDSMDNVTVVITDNMTDAIAAIESHDDWLVAIVGLYLLDAPKGEIVDLMKSYNLPVIVLTGEMNESVRQEILRKNVIDYVIKRNKSEIEYVANLVKRIENNRQTWILVVDDSLSQRIFITQLLEAHQYNVLEAEDGQAALAVMDKHPEISVVISDYEMPVMNGIELLGQIRERFARDKVSVIGISSSADENLSALLLKAGANDFLRKPFIVEEFYCRISQNVEIIEQMNYIKDASNRDYLTKLYNRRYFFRAGEQIHMQAKDKQIYLCAAMIDIDYFKDFNDAYGHAAGDEAIRMVASTIQSSVPQSSVVARYGGEEFCVLLHSTAARNFSPIFEKLRKRIESQQVEYNNKKIPLTVSVGVSEKLGNSLEDMLNNADKLLYRAKESGRNRVVLAA